MRADPARLNASAYRWSRHLATRYGDMDANGHLNNVAIARLFEEARVQFNWESASLLAGARPRFLAAHVAIDYLAEGHYPGDIAGLLAVSHIGTSSFRLAMAAFQAGRAIALCDSVLVHRGADGGPAPLPDQLRARLEAHRLTA
jgi:acyl-CoA thioester hydrolase